MNDLTLNEILANWRKRTDEHMESSSLMLVPPPTMYALLACAEAARDLLAIGLRNDGERLCVVERDDNTDPHYRLCEAIERLGQL